MCLRVAEKRMRQKFEDRWNTGIYLGLLRGPTWSWSGRRMAL